MLQNLDLSVFYTLYAFGTQFSVPVVLVAEKFLYVVLALLLFFTWRAWQKGQWTELYVYGVALLSAVLARGVLTEIIRYFYHSVRPYAALNLTPLFIDTAYSFPSGHTIFIFALATGVWYVNRPLAYVLYAMGLLIGLARVASGVHYPSDILGGAVLGVLVAVGVYSVYEKITTKRSLK